MWQTNGLKFANIFTSFKSLFNNIYLICKIKNRKRKRQQNDDDLDPYLLRQWVIPSFFTNLPLSPNVTLTSHQLYIHFSNFPQKGVIPSPIFPWFFFNFYIINKIQLFIKTKRIRKRRGLLIHKRIEGNKMKYKRIEGNMWEENV